MTGTPELSCARHGHPPAPSAPAKATTHTVAANVQLVDHGGIETDSSGTAHR